MNWWDTLSIEQKKQLAARTKTAMRAGLGQNQATTSAAQTMGISIPAASTPPAPTPPPAPEIIKPPVQRQATQSSVGQGVRQARGSKKRTRLSDLRISRPRVNTQLAIGAGGTGLNIGGY